MQRRDIRISLNHNSVNEKKLCKSQLFRKAIVKIKQIGYNRTSFRKKRQEQSYEQGACQEEVG